MEQKNNRFTKSFSLPSKTKQSFKEECDVNNIIKKFKKISNSDFLHDNRNALGGQYGDFADLGDYRAALEQVRAANEAFMALPAKVRKEFDNDAAVFVDFCSDPTNANELVKMGLTNPKVEASAEKGSSPDKVA